ncbi:hypothetical protein [Bacteroides acidifaciens]|jgi:hypothetical protein|uniref:hypothetical protein n=1 Tax=Bacteroides acidifaciens TaxID=85831 RepID=UPI00258BD42F|nr:hypothetical protein [Bacteroides acidifaciens]
MKRKPKIQIRFGKILAAVQSFIFSPFLMFFVFLGTISNSVLTGWERYRHWLCNKIDNPKKK